MLFRSHLFSKAIAGTPFQERKGKMGKKERNGKIKKEHGTEREVSKKKRERNGRVQKRNGNGAERGVLKKERERNGQIEER